MENKDEFPCETCAWIGCSIYMKYVLKSQKEDHENSKEAFMMFKDILTLTGCKKWIKDEWKYANRSGNKTDD
jgi:hypothetical protein